MDAYTSLLLHLKDRLYASVAVSYGLVMYRAKINEGKMNLLLSGSHTINKTKAGRSSPLYIGALECASAHTSAFNPVVHYTDIRSTTVIWCEAQSSLSCGWTGKKAYIFLFPFIFKNSSIYFQNVYLYISLKCLPLSVSHFNRGRIVCKVTGSQYWFGYA